MAVLKFLTRMSLVFGLALCGQTASGARAADQISISGTGMGLALAARLAESVSAKTPDLKIEVLPSMGTSGGLRALTDGVIQIAIAARQLKPEERAIGLQERACLITPLLFATSRDSGGTIALADLPEIYSDPVRTWPDGMPLKG